MNSIAVRTETVCKGFGTGEARTEVLKEVNFEARMGELLMLVGPSGCGKTTLLSVIAGTLGVDRGEVEVFDSPLHRLEKRAVTRFRAANIGFIFQQYNLIPTLNCIENVSVPLRIQGASAAAAEKRAAEMLETVGLGQRMHHRPNMLSGGQQQRVAIARALVHDPRLIICDEPTAALDSENGQKVMEILKKVAPGPTVASSSSRTTLSAQSEAVSRAVASARTTATLAGERYQQGLTSYLDVVDAQRAALQAELTEVQPHGHHAVSKILLAKALGGLASAGCAADRHTEMNGPDASQFVIPILRTQAGVCRLHADRPAPLY